MKSKINIVTHYYDFDDTLIPGDSILYWKRFYFKKRPRMRIWQIFSWIGLVAYLLRLIDSLTLENLSRTYLLRIKRRSRKFSKRIYP